MAEIVVIEDNLMIRDLWVEVLTLKGYQVTGFSCAGHALDAIQRRPPGLVLVDLGPRHVWQAEVVAEIRRDFSEARLPIVVVSGSQDENDMRDAFNSGATDYLVKPVGPTELSSKVKVHLRNSDRMKKVTLTTQYLPGELACGKYLVEETLGEGTYGVVYAARELESGREVALKILTSETPIDRSRFLRECYTLAGLDYRGVVKVYDLGEEEGTVFLAMERIKGVTLEVWLRGRETATGKEIGEFVLGLSCALEGLESRGVLHRDIKPSNIMLRDGNLGDPVLIDFGLAKRAHEVGLTSPNMMLGTPGYMPPEVLAGSVLDSRCDLFAVGMVARFLATGQEAYPHLVGYELLQRMAVEPVPMPTEIEPVLRRLLEDMTAVNREERPSARQLRTRLLACPLAS
jgi:serine/threonine protein kinase